MRILFICSKNKGWIVPFIAEQAESIRNLGHDVEFFCVEGKGVKGYLKCWAPLKKKINEYKPDIIHAHYGLCGLLANFQRKIPVVTTYPGSDINDSKVRPFSIISIKLSKYNLFMGTRQMDKVKRYLNKNSEILRYGIMADNFIPMNKSVARERMGLNQDDKLVIFAGKFANKVKNAELAKQAVAQLDAVKLMELTGGYTKQEMCYLMNSVDAAIMTSHSEGSPQFIKEVMACGCPIVSVDVGDVAEVVNEVDGCYITDRNPENIASALKKAIFFEGKTNGRDRILELGLTNEQVAEKLIKIYSIYVNV